MTEASNSAYPHDCEHPREQHLGPEGVCQTSECLCIAADYMPPEEANFDFLDPEDRG